MFSFLNITECPFADASEIMICEYSALQCLNFKKDVNV